MDKVNQLVSWIDEFNFYVTCCDSAGKVRKFHGTIGKPKLNGMRWIRLKETNTPMKVQILVPTDTCKKFAIHGVILAAINPPVLAVLFYD